MGTVIMKRPVKSTVLLLICILMLPMFMGIFNIKSANCLQVTDWWPMFHHDLTHSGYSTSTAPTTNQTLWNYTTEDEVWSSPAVVDGVVFVGSYAGKVYALNATDGSLVWSYTTGDCVFSSPAVVDGVVFVGSCDYNVYAFGMPDDVSVGGELSQTGYIESFFVPELVMLGISGAIVMLGFIRIKRSKQTRSKPHNA